MDLGRIEKNTGVTRTADKMLHLAKYLLENEPSDKSKLLHASPNLSQETVR